MKKLILTSLFMAFLLAPYAFALSVNVESIDGPQDPLFVNGAVHEFGDGFPTDELITSAILGLTSDTACFDGSDDPGIPNVLVEIINLTNLTVPLWYVADTSTTISNFDGWIGNAGLGDFEEAFRIDSVGINRPLVFESMASNNLFEPGEIWHFIIQDFANAAIPPVPFASLGIAGASTVDAISSGSLITPEPTTVLLLAFGTLLMRGKRS